MRIVFLFIFGFIVSTAHSQTFENNKFTKAVTWTLMQAVPSPGLIIDENDDQDRFILALKWNIIPINYSFNMNKLTSPVSFFVVNPIKRLSGSLEAFVQPVWVNKTFKYTDMKRFYFNTGIRGYLPILEQGESLAISMGGYYSFRKSIEGNDISTPGIEAGIYTLYGILGVTINYNFSETANYGFGLSLKYY